MEHLKHTSTFFRQRNTAHPIIFQFLLSLMFISRFVVFHNIFYQISKSRTILKGCSYPKECVIKSRINLADIRCKGRSNEGSI